MVFSIAISAHIQEGRPGRDRLSMHPAERNSPAEQNSPVERNSPVEARSRVAVHTQVEGRMDSGAPVVVVRADRIHRWGVVGDSAGVVGTTAPVAGHLVGELDVADIHDLVVGSLVSSEQGQDIAVRCN